MSSPVRILAFAGSVRHESFNRRLIQLGVEQVRATGAEVTLLDLADYPLPFMDEDLEKSQGLPENARKLKKLFIEHEGLLLSCPEYNSSITPLLKNVIDWVSRKEGDETPLVAYKGKVAGLISASPSMLGGLRGLVTVRSILGNIGVLVLPEQITVAKAHEAFTPEGALKDAGTAARLMNLAETLNSTVKRLKAG